MRVEHERGKVDMLSALGSSVGRDRMKASEIEKMSATEKLQAIEALWDALDGDEVESPEWHEDVLNERKKLIESGDAKFISLEKLKQYTF